MGSVDKRITHEFWGGAYCVKVVRSLGVVTLRILEGQEWDELDEETTLEIYRSLGELMGVSDVES